jgi:hypothetical protein
MVLEVLKLTIPAILTLVGNFAFYRYIKSKADKEVEKFKIVSAGVYSKKIEFTERC